MYALVLTRKEVTILRVAVCMAKDIYEKDYQKKLDAVNANENSLSVISYRNAAEQFAAFCELQRKVDLLLR